MIPNETKININQHNLGSIAFTVTNAFKIDFESKDTWYRGVIYQSSSYPLQIIITNELV